MFSMHGNIAWLKNNRSTQHTRKKTYIENAFPTKFAFFVFGRNVKNINSRSVNLCIRKYEQKKIH